MDDFDENIMAYTSETNPTTWVFILTILLSVAFFTDQLTFISNYL